MNFLVVGASGYVGSALQKVLTSSGHGVLGTCLSNDSNKDAFVFDILSDKDRQSLARRIDAFDTLDGIAFCHSLMDEDVFKSASLTDLNAELLEKLERGYGSGPVKLIQKLLPKLAHSPNPNIVFTGSFSRVKNVKAPPAFGYAKSQITGHLLSLTKNLGSMNIKVNSVDPGVLEGGMSGRLTEKMRADYLKHCALKRFGKAEEVANTISWILTKNTYVTGQSFLLDGAL